MVEQNSVTEWIQAVRRKDEIAAEELWNRYFGQLMRVARSRMSRMPRSAYDEEDAALSTFRVLCGKLQQGNYLELGSRDELWNLMVKILVRKVGHRFVYESAEKRTRPESFGDLARAQTPATNPLASECDELLSQLGNINLEQVAIWKLEGFTNDEIATRLNRTRRTVQRMLELIRSIWQEKVID